MKDRVGFAKVYGMPLMVGKFEPTAIRVDREALIYAARSLGSNAVGLVSVLPNGLRLRSSPLPPLYESEPDTSSEP
jgi:phage gp29-like protein